MKVKYQLIHGGWFAYVLFRNTFIVKVMQLNIKLFQGIHVWALINLLEYGSINIITSLQTS